MSQFQDTDRFVVPQSAIRDWSRLSSMGFVKRPKEDLPHHMVEVQVPGGWKVDYNTLLTIGCIHAVDAKKRHRLFIPNKGDVRLVERYSLSFSRETGWFILADRKMEVDSNLGDRIDFAYARLSVDQFKVGVVHRNTFHYGLVDDYLEERINFPCQRDRRTNPLVTTLPWDGETGFLREVSPAINSTLLSINIYHTIYNTFAFEYRERLDQLPIDGSEWGDGYDDWFADLIKQV